MTFPSGAQGGGFPGQGPQQPQQGPGYGPPSQGGGGLKLGLPQILFLVTAGLGLVIVFLGFAPAISVEGRDGVGFYEVSQGGSAGLSWIPVACFVAGLISALIVLPGKQKPSPGVPAVLSLGAVFGLLFTMFSADFPDQAGFGAGAIMILIFGILQLGAAVVAFLFDAGIIKAPAPGQRQQPYGQQPGGFGPPSGGFPQPGQQPGQQTQFAPQQGQFGQQPGQQPGGAPGTPPGGYPQS
ncbi:hypothetical protein EV193_106162 [Herbihabitans rhizosphaerae]|uniref:34 kDa antigenic protein n=1 Tax=Herbihabitans rhizosphaerae TaxID=1872711 RepID=A0A4Q7KK08_9PSEU|nr:DUF5336 domain-containing protein [Herbihabitans rhizosphaerae]RZS36928.1 hypothetical protein EV193_106162 [Herbihabitans rhizosphaerae]